MPLKEVTTLTQWDNDWVDYTSAEEMLRTEQTLSDFTLDQVFDMLEELDPNVFGGRRSEIIQVIKDQIIEFDPINKVVTKTRIWPDQEAHDLYYTELWEDVEALHPGKRNYNKEVVIESI